MGRFYSGDINGKFWFAVQASDDADNFGRKGKIDKNESFISYDFKEKDIPKVKKGIKDYKLDLDIYKKKLDDFFEHHEDYNDEMISLDFDISIKKVKEILVLYARLELGEKILNCLKKKKKCSFFGKL